MPTGQFFLNVGVGADGGTIHPSIRFLKNLPKVRLLMHLYRFWLKHPELDKEKAVVGRATPLNRPQQRGA